jgi:hypothetical protein
MKNKRKQFIQWGHVHPLPYVEIVAAMIVLPGALFALVVPWPWGVPMAMGVGWWIAGVFPAPWKVYELRKGKIRLRVAVVIMLTAVVVAAGAVAVAAATGHLPVY